MDWRDKEGTLSEHRSIDHWAHRRVVWIYMEEGTGHVQIIVNRQGCNIRTSKNLWYVKDETSETVKYCGLSWRKQFRYLCTDKYRGTSTLRYSTVLCLSRRSRYRYLGGLKHYKDPEGCTWVIKGNNGFTFLNVNTYLILIPNYLHIDPLYWVFKKCEGIRWLVPLSYWPNLFSMPSHFF